MQFPAQLAHIIDAQGTYFHARNFNVLAATPPKILIVQRCISEFGKYIPRLRADQREHATLIGCVANRDLFARFDLLREVVEIAHFSASRREQIEVLAGNTSYSCFTQNTTVARQKVCQSNTTITFRHSIGQYAIEKTFSIGSADVIFCEAC